MIQIQLQLEDKTINLDPLDNVTVPSCLDLNDTLQHQESQVNIRIEYDSYIHKILVENNSIPVTMIEDGKKIFTGIIDSGLSWVDNGTPEPLDNISLVIFDNSYKLQNTAETPITYIDSYLSEIITNICNLCHLQFDDKGLLDAIKIPVFILNRDQEYYQAVNDLLFEYGFAFGFTGAGALTIISLKQPYDDQIIDNLFTGVKFSRTQRKFTGIELNYGRITTKYNEQVYFEGGDLGEDNKIVPIIITPGSYYPFESAPQIESTEGQVYQEFASGYAETQNLYNGEKRYTRSKDTQLLYTEKHTLVKDYSDNLTVDRTEFEYTQASVRFINNSNKDAELKQLAIKATAYYRSPVQLVRGEGKKFKYDSKYIYDKDSANALAALMQHYFLGGNFKITFKTTQKLIPGQKTQVNTGLSGITTNVIILSVTKDIYSEIYDITALTEQNITLDEKKWQIQKSMTASQVLERTEIDSITIQTISTEYYLSESRTELIGGTWTKTPPTATANKYIWTKNIYTYTDGRTEESEPVSISGDRGETGAQGAQGPKGDTGAQGAQGPQGEDSLGFAVKLNVSNLSTTANGTIFVSGYENSAQANVNGYVRYLGNKISVTKTALKPNNQFVGWIAIPAAGGTPVLAYITVAGQWKSISNGTSTNITGSNYVAIAEAKFESSIKATASSIIEPIRLDVLGGNIRSIYYGKASSNPSFSAGLVIGHFYLNTSNGNIYSFNGITWEVNNATDLQMQCMTDLLEIAQNSSSIGTPTFINKLVAYRAFIDKLLSKEVTIDASTFGFIKSTDFATTDDLWLTQIPLPSKGFGIIAGSDNGYASSMGAAIVRSLNSYAKEGYVRNLYTNVINNDGRINANIINVSDSIVLNNVESAQTSANLPTTYISTLSTGKNYKPTSGHIETGSLWLGDGMANGLKYINASSTSFDTAALIVGAMGSKTIGVGIIASAYSTNSGYVKFANGLLIQWGQSTSTSSNSRQIPFLINFSNTNYQITGTQILTSSGGSNADKSPRIYSKEPSSAYVWTSDKAPFDWVAVGY